MRTHYYLVLITALSIVIASCRKQEEMKTDNTTNENRMAMISENGQNPDMTAIGHETALHHQDSYLYTESNATALNEVLVYRQHPNGSLTLAGTYASGGNGVGIFNGLGLDSQGALALNEHKHWLFAVNAGR